MEFTAAEKCPILAAGGVPVGFVATQLLLAISYLNTVLK